MKNAITLRRCLPAAALLTLAFMSTPARADQFVAVDVTYTHSADTTKDSHYFVKPSAATPSNWRAPVNYAGGSVYMHLEVLTKPSSEPTVWVICFIGSPGYACTDTGVHTTTGVFERNVTLPSIWQYDQVDWSQTITQIPIILKDDNNVKVAPENVGAARSALFMPTKLRAVVTIVSVGGTYVPPISGDEGALDGGGAGTMTDGSDPNTDQADDAAHGNAPDREPDPPSSEASAPTVTKPTDPVATLSEAGNAPSETSASPYESEGAGCSVGRGRPSTLVAFLLLSLLARRRRTG